MCYKIAIFYPDGTWSVVSTSSTAKNCDRSHKFYERYCVRQLLKARGCDFLYSLHRFCYLADLCGLFKRLFKVAYPEFGDVSPRLETYCRDSEQRCLFVVLSFIDAGRDN